ncbi:putative nuclease HARBI1, partial [Rhagoletis pomonella]|uniref:putative nuclease HARBI1 n=1 Tax=Rhagoletis pomonella TaxID=28610 RepID=UPI0017862F3F
LRDKEDPFALDENTFRDFFRLPKSLCWDLIQGLKPHDSRKFGISFELRFISVLYFLSNGSYQSCVGSGHFCAMSQASVSRNINYICRLVVEHKHSEISFPNTTEQYNNIINNIKKKLFNKFGIKGVIGAIDCTHIAILAPVSLTPNIVAHDYMNRKGYYSVNVEAVSIHTYTYVHMQTFV